MLWTWGQADETIALAVDAVIPTKMPVAAAAAATAVSKEKDACMTGSEARITDENRQLHARQPSRSDVAPVSAGGTTGKLRAASEKSVMQCLVANQLKITGCIVLAVLLANAFGFPVAERFVYLSERRTRADGSVFYMKTQDDVFLLAFYAVLFTFVRSASMSYILIPFANRWFACGGTRRVAGRTEGAAAAPVGRRAAAPPTSDVGEPAKRLPENGRRGEHRTAMAVASRPRKHAHPKSVRFAEQGWVFLYYSVYWSIGMYIMSHSPTWYYRTKAFWEDYPHLEMTALQKWYYLSQAGFWISQLWVVQTETKRKDHIEMVLHHIVTSALIASSYILNFTRIGTAVFVMMDTSDILLPLAKMLLYLKLQRACDSVFVIFVLSWIYTRHYLYFFVLRSIWLESSILATYPPHPENPYNEPGKYAFVALFLVLQVLVLYWFFLICKILYRVVIGKGADDTREGSSDEEDDFKEDEESNYEADVNEKQD